MFFFGGGGGRGNLAEWNLHVGGPGKYWNFHSWKSLQMHPILWRTHLLLLISLHLFKIIGGGGGYPSYGPALTSNWDLNTAVNDVPFTCRKYQVECYLTLTLELSICYWRLAIIWFIFCKNINRIVLFSFLVCAFCSEVYISHNISKVFWTLIILVSIFYDNVWAKLYCHIVIRYIENWGELNIKWKQST